MSASLSLPLSENPGQPRRIQPDYNGPSMKPASEYPRAQVKAEDHQDTASPIVAAAVRLGMQSGVFLSEQTGPLYSRSMLGIYLADSNIDASALGPIELGTMAQLFKSFNDVTSKKSMQLANNVIRFLIGAGSLGESWPPAVSEDRTFEFVVRELKELIKSNNQVDAVKPSQRIVRNIDFIGNHLACASQPEIEWDDSTGATTLVWTSNKGRTSFSLVFTDTDYIIGVTSDLDRKSPEPWKVLAADLQGIWTAITTSSQQFLSIRYL